MIEKDINLIKAVIFAFETSVAFKLCNDFYIEDNNWHEIKHDLSKSDLDFKVISFIKDAELDWDAFIDILETYFDDNIKNKLNIIDKIVKVSKNRTSAAKAIAKLHLFDDMEDLEDELELINFIKEIGE